MTLAKPAGDACAQCPGRSAPCVLPEAAASPAGARLAIVGESPGRNEVAQGRPFIGASGKMLERGLKSLGLSRGDVHWTNAVLCDVSPGDLRDARKACAKRLRDELDAVGAAIVVPVGAHGLTSALGLSQRAKIVEWRGSVTHDKGKGRYVCPTVHPAFVMRAQQWGPVLEGDFERIGRVMANGWEAPEDAHGRRIVIASVETQLTNGPDGRCNVPGACGLLDELDETVAIDVETVGLGPTSTALVCLAISDTKLSVVIPWTRDQAGREPWWSAWAQAEIVASINRCLARRVAVTHNGLAFDHIVLHRYGIQEARWEDTILMAHAAHSHMPKRLSFSVQRYCDVPPWKTFDHAKSIDALHVYNGRDSLYTAMAVEPLRKAMRDAGQEHIYEIDKRTGLLCRDMQVNGFRMDRGRAEAMAARLAARENEIEARCCEAIGREINLLSPLQLREAFFGRGGLGAHVCYRSERTGAPSLGVDVMRAYAASPNERLATFATDLLAYRRCRKVRIANLQHPLEALDDRDRIHATWMNYGAVSGRFSSSAPNMMNLPTVANDPTITHDCGRESCVAGRCKCDCERCAGVRSIYCARPGWTLMSFDRKQLEMRIAAYASQDPAMILACESSDMHSANAEVIFEGAFVRGSPAERFQFRQLAKSAGFAVCYKAEAPTVYERIVAMGVRVTLRQVEAMLRKMRTKFRRYYEWQDDEFEGIVSCGYVYEPVTGRRRWLGKEPSLTEAANFPIQGGAAGLMNLQLPQLCDAAREARLPHFALAQVHDSGTFEVRNDAVGDFRAIADSVLAQPIMLGGEMRTFPSDWKVSERWA